MIYTAFCIPLSAYILVAEYSAGLLRGTNIVRIGMVLRWTVRRLYSTLGEISFVIRRLF